METQLITNNKVSQNFNTILNQVKNQSIRFNVIQEQTIVAQIIPPRKKIHIAELDQLFATSPRLDKEDIDAFEQDIQQSINLINKRYK